MKLVIEINESKYERLKFLVEQGFGTDIDEIIVNATPLPKGHGRLIDASALLMDFAFANSKSAGECVHDALTIIEADKENDNEVSN